MAYVQLHDYGNLEDKTLKRSTALFSFDSSFMLRAIHVVITSIHIVPKGQRQRQRHRERERRRDIGKVYVSERKGRRDRLNLVISRQLTADV